MSGFSIEDRADAHCDYLTLKRDERELDKTIEILEAFRDGKSLEYFSFNYINGVGGQIWVDWLPDYKTLKKQLFEYGFVRNIRIKKASTSYRPFANAEEFLKAEEDNKEWLIRKEFYNNPQCSFPDITKAIYCNNEEVHLGGTNPIEIGFKRLFEEYVWKKTGNPCGILIKCNKYYTKGNNV